MGDHELYAVVTGDIVGSTKLKAGQRSQLLRVIKRSLRRIDDILPGKVCAPFTIHRGDSFQGVLSKPEAALRAVIIIRAGVRFGSQTRRLRHALDARAAVGIGTVDFLPAGRASEGDGEAFHRSGQTLDVMKGDQRLVFRTPWQEIDTELDVECALLDALVNRWSAEQAGAILAQIRGLTQEQAAEEFGISQPAVRQRLERAGGWAVERLCRRYERLIAEAISSKAYNEDV